jgi:hypothetical protein
MAPHDTASIIARSKQIFPGRYTYEKFIYVSMYEHVIFKAERNGIIYYR